MSETKTGENSSRFEKDGGAKTPEKREQKDFTSLLREWPQQWCETLGKSLRQAIDGGVTQETFKRVGRYDEKEKIIYYNTGVTFERKEEGIEENIDVVCLLDLLRNVTEEDNKKVVKVKKAMDDYYGSAEYKGVEEDADKASHSGRDESYYDSDTYTNYIKERVYQRWDYIVQQARIKPIDYARKLESRIGEIAQDAEAEKIQKEYEKGIQRSKDLRKSLFSGKDPEYVRGTILLDALSILAKSGGWTGSSFMRSRMNKWADANFGEKAACYEDEKARKFREQQIVSGPVQFVELLKQVEKLPRPVKPKTVKSKTNERW